MRKLYEGFYWGGILIMFMSLPFRGLEGFVILFYGGIMGLMSIIADVLEGEEKK